MMFRRTLLSLSLFAAVPAYAAPPTPADAPLIQQVETYLNQVQSMSGRFVQSSGHMATGQFWIQRPGNMLFEYDPPDPLRLVAHNGTLVFQDTKLGQVSKIGLGSTPLSILLASHVSLSGATRLTDIQDAPTQVQLSLVLTNNPGEGLLAIVLAKNPWRLVQWTVEDAQARITEVRLAQVQINPVIDPARFTLPHE